MSMYNHHHISDLTFKHWAQKLRMSRKYFPKFVKYFPPMAHAAIKGIPKEEQEGKRCYLFLCVSRKSIPLIKKPATISSFQFNYYPEEEMMRALHTRISSEISSPIADMVKEAWGKQMDRVQVYDVSALIEDIQRDIKDADGACPQLRWVPKYLMRAGHPRPGASL